MSGGAAPRLAFYYAAVFGLIGVYLPFFPLWLASRGLDAEAIGTLLAATALVRVFTTPWIGGVADRMGERRRPMMLLAALTFVGFAAYSGVHGFWAILAASVLAGVCQAGLMPLGETVAMAAVTARGFDYGRLRLWGSLSFIACSAGAGWLLDGRSAELVVWILAAGAALIVVASASLPEPALAPSPRTRGTVRRLLADPTFALFLATCGALQASHAVYYALAPVDWKAAGFDEAAIGLLSAEAVAAEVVLFAASGAAVARLGPAGLLALSGTAGVVRWIVMAVSRDPAAIAGAQILHAFTFGAAHLAAMHFIQRAAPAGLAASAQSTYSAVGMGLSMGVALLASGPLYASFGQGAYGAMAGLSLAGLAGAALLARRWRGGRIA